MKILLTIFFVLGFTTYIAIESLIEPSSFNIKMGMLGGITFCVSIVSAIYLIKIYKELLNVNK